MRTSCATSGTLCTCIATGSFIYRRIVSSICTTISTASSSSSSSCGACFASFGTTVLPVTASVFSSPYSAGCSFSTLSFPPVSIVYSTVPESKSKSEVFQVGVLTLTFRFQNIGRVLTVLSVVTSAVHAKPAAKMLVCSQDAANGKEWS